VSHNLLKIVEKIQNFYQRWGKKLLRFYRTILLSHILRFYRTILLSHIFFPWELESLNDFEPKGLMYSKSEQFMVT